jgi:hypothetical protein
MWSAFDLAMVAGMPDLRFKRRNPERQNSSSSAFLPARSRHEKRDQDEEPKRFWRK